MILERATGRSVSAFLAETIWQPLGMEAPATWSLDSSHDGVEKMERGLNARAIDFAKFARLYLKAATGRTARCSRARGLRPPRAAT
jgi:CubicO group peptidase (beta-lactamase class C family)